MSKAHDEVAARLDLLATVAQATLGSVLRILKARQEGPLTAEQKEKLEQVRNDLRRALQGIEGWEESHSGSDLDLSRLRQRIEDTLEALAEEPGGPSDPPTDLTGEN